MIRPKGRLIRANISAGDAIVLFESSGIHANGLTLARAIADRAPNGYLSLLRDGRTYGDALLDPTHIYVGVIEDCLNRGVDLHYAVNITGHGWRKLMRATEPFAYLIDAVPAPQPVFEFMQGVGDIDDREAYGNLNMGAGFAVYVPECEVNAVLEVAGAFPFRAMRAGHIEPSQDKRVVIGPKGIEFSGATLAVRVSPLTVCQGRPWSSSTCGVFTRSSQLLGSSIGPRSRTPGLSNRHRRLLHCQNSARVTRCALTGLRSMYRQTRSRCRSSSTGTDLKRDWYTAPRPVSLRTLFHRVAWVVASHFMNAEGLPRRVAIAANANGWASGSTQEFAWVFVHGPARAATESQSTREAIRRDKCLLSLD
jgi:hypothetical protein